MIWWVYLMFRATSTNPWQFVCGLDSERFHTVPHGINDRKQGEGAYVHIVFDEQADEEDVH